MQKSRKARTFWGTLLSFHHHRSIPWPFYCSRRTGVLSAVNGLLLARWYTASRYLSFRCVFIACSSQRKLKLHYRWLSGGDHPSEIILGTVAVADPEDAVAPVYKLNMDWAWVSYAGVLSAVMFPSSGVPIFSHCELQFLSFQLSL